MKSKRTILTAVIVVALGGIVWAILPASPDPQLVKVQQLQQKLFRSDAKLSDAERREGFDELRRESEKLTEEQRDKLMQDFRDNPPEFVRRMQKDMVDFFDKPKAEQDKILDKQIDEFEKRRKQWEKNRGDRSKGPPGGFRGGNMDGKAANDMRKKMLDNTSPQQRAMMGEYFERMNQRRQERGMPPWGGPGGR